MHNISIIDGLSSKKEKEEKSEIYLTTPSTLLLFWTMDITYKRGKITIELSTKDARTLRSVIGDAGIYWDEEEEKGEDSWESSQKIRASQKKVDKFLILLSNIPEKRRRAK